MSQAAVRKPMAQPADEATEKYRQLIHQNRNFCHALMTAIKSGRETAAGVTATVRDRKKAAFK